MTTKEGRNRAGDRIEVVTSVLIAVVTVLTAAVVWRASVLSDGATGAERLGIINTLKAAAALVLIGFALMHRSGFYRQEFVVRAFQICYALTQGTISPSQQPASLGSSCAAVRASAALGMAAAAAGYWLRGRNFLRVSRSPMPRYAQDTANKYKEERQIEELWRTIKEALKLEISPANYQTYVQDTHAIAFDRNTGTLLVEASPPRPCCAPCVDTPSQLCYTSPSGRQASSARSHRPSYGGVLGCPVLSQIQRESLAPLRSI